MNSLFNQILRSARVPLIIVGLIWLVKGIELLEGFELGFLGIYPMHVKGLPGIIFSPFIHGDISHAANNTLPILFLGTALHFAYPKLAVKVWLSSILFTGIWVWVAARPSYHIGASGVVYALFGFLFVRGLLSRQRRLMGLCLLVAFLYGSMVWGIFPIEDHVSWEAHMFGLMAGISLAVYYRKESEYRKPAPWELVGEEHYVREAEERFGIKYWEGNTANKRFEKDPEVKIVYHYSENKKSSTETDEDSN